MKRFLSVVLCFMLTLCVFAACGAKTEVSPPEHFPIGAGMLRSFAVDEGGSVYYWGIDFGTEENIGTEDFSTIPEHLVTEPQLVTEGVSSVFATDCSALFLKEDGSLWILGTPTMTGDFCAPEPVWLMDNVVSADLSGSDILAVDGDGALWTFKNSLNQPVKLLEDIAYVSAYTGGGWYAVGRDGSLWERDSDVCVMENVAVAVCAGQTSAAIKKDGSLWVWSGDSVTKPTKIDKDVIYVEAGEVSQYESCVMYITSDSALWVIGYDSRTGETYDKPKKIMDGAAAVSIYGSFVLAAKTDGTVEGWGDNSMGGLCSADLEATGPLTIPVPKTISPR